MVRLEEGENGGLDWRTIFGFTLPFWF